MKIEASYSSYPQLMTEFRQNSWISTHPIGVGTQTNWHSPFITGRNRFFNLSSGLKIHDWSQTFLKNWELVDLGCEQAPVTFIFLMQGRLQGTYRDSTYFREVNVEAGHSLLMFSGLGKRGVWRCPQSLSCKTIEVVVEVKKLLGYLEHELPSTLIALRRLLSEQSEQPYFHTGAITPAMQMVLHQYLNCPYEGMMQRMYLESKAVELIALKLSQIKQMTTQVSAADRRRSLKSQDIDRVHHARAILLQDMANPPSLGQLAEQVGIGDYKLKQDFRQAFGTTVFGYLRSHRLECARQLITAQQMNVSEAARFVGYSSLSKFTAAFKRQFGILPSSCSTSKN
ncbi:MAG: AraC family transcriptional regulator [Cyanobacteria bacterium P01_D01_bin.105]